MAYQNKYPAALLSELGITTPKQIQLDVIAQYCGATILYEQLEGCDAYLVGGMEKAIIVVNEKSPPSRQRFSIAHELGHWMHDRGKITTICKAEPGGRSQNAHEKRANQYAQDLLLPEAMFRPLAQGREITLATVKELAQVFNASLTATAIRLVEFGSFPAMVICTRNERPLWSRSNKYLPPEWLVTRPGLQTITHQLSTGKIRTFIPQEIAASEWIGHQDCSQHRIQEDCIRISEDQILTLLWWKD